MFTDVFAPSRGIIAMITLYKNTANSVALTLTEKMSDVTNAFAFRLTNDSSGEVKVFAAPDESDATGRYNRFTWTEDATEDLRYGTVELREGQWSYEAFEVPVETPPAIDVTGLTPIETGRVQVKDTPAADDFFAPTETTKIFYS